MFTLIVEECFCTSHWVRILNLTVLLERQKMQSIRGSCIIEITLATPSKSLSEFAAYV